MATSKVGGHGGSRVHRKTKSVDMKILHAEVLEDHYEWVEQVAAGLKICKGEALDKIIARDKARVIRRAEKSYIEQQ